jgi:hypothetical protein
VIKNQYPFSTFDGQVIPLDIIRPAGCFVLPFDAVIGLSPIDLGVEIPILVLEATQDCFVSFGRVAEIPAIFSLDTIFLKKGKSLTVAPKATTISVIGWIASGDLIVQLVEQWAGLGHENANVSK